MIISTNTEKIFDKIHQLFLIKKEKKKKKLNKLGIEGNFLNLIRDIYEKPTANSILKDEKLDASPLRSGTIQVCPLLSLCSTLYWKFQPKQSGKKNKEWIRKLWYIYTMEYYSAI